MNTYECAVAIIRNSIKWDDLNEGDKKKIEDAVQSWRKWRMASSVTFIDKTGIKMPPIRGVCNVNDIKDRTFLFVNQPTVNDTYTKLTLMDHTVHDVTENKIWHVPTNGDRVQLISYN